MLSPQEDENSRYKLAQLRHLVNRIFFSPENHYSLTKIVHGLLKDNFNINHKVTIIDHYWPDFINYLKDCTALHFSYFKVQNIDTFNTLLDRGADFTIKNGNGQTALHLIITDCSKDDVQKELPFVNSVLSAHVKMWNSVNPQDDNGLSHLHGACISNYVEAVVLFLIDGASFNEAVNVNAPQFAGYTPLHFATEFHSFEVTQMLISYGADVNAQTATGMSPLDLLMEGRHRAVDMQEREKTIKILLEKSAISAAGLSSLQVACCLNDLAIAQQYLNKNAEVDYFVPMKSPICPGKTALHFAADNSIESVKMLLKAGAKIDVVDAKGSTPLDICVNKYSLQEVHNILSCVDSWKEIRLSDGETRLLDVIASMNNSDHFKLFLEKDIKDVTAVVPSDSPLLPGYTILHLSVTLSKLAYENLKPNEHSGIKIAEECLRHGLSLNEQNVRGQTPIHLAFGHGKNKIVELFLEHLNRLDQLTDIADQDELSYLHIACAMKDTPLVEKLLEKSKVNIAFNGRRIDDRLVEPGSTPLHVAAKNGSHTIADLLLRHGANLHMTDESGFTPIHWLLNHSFYVGQQIANVLFSSLLAKLEDHVVSGVGLNYLHISCRMGNAEVAEKLLDLGSNIEAVINYNKNAENLLSDNAISRVRGKLNCTPLQVALLMEDPDDNHAIIDLLISRGADMFVKASNIPSNRFNCIPLKNTIVVRRFFRLLWDRDDMQKCWEEMFGLTKLHIACYMKSEWKVRSALSEGIDINAQVNVDSEIFAGCTPLHLLMIITFPEESYNLPESDFVVSNMINLLVDQGADVTIANANKDTPIHLFYKYEEDFLDRDLCQDSLLNAQQNFSVNPVNTEGLSHLHLACFWQKFEVVEKFLRYDSVNVNLKIDCFAKENPGCTPLHLALIPETDDWPDVLRIVDLLLKHGADVGAKDIYGDTPLHKPAVFRSPEMSILEELIRHGGDINSKNIRCQTPVEICPDIHGDIVNPSDHFRIFQKYGYKINSWNQLTEEGYIAKIFLWNRENLAGNSEFKEFIKSPDIRAVDDMGRTVIHNSVALSNNMSSQGIENYIYAIKSFIEIGIDIDHQDNSGLTALHYAARMENVPGVEALLACGADVNVLDSSGKSAFTYAVETSTKINNSRKLIPKNVTVVLRIYIMKLQYLRIEVNEHIIREVENYLKSPNYVQNLSHVSLSFNLQVLLSKLKLNREDSLYNYLCELGATNRYPFLVKPVRDEIDKFFGGIDFTDYDELVGIINLQFKKMKRRFDIIDNTLGSLKKLLGFSFPTKLCWKISLYLSFNDLKNLNKSTRLKRKMSDIASRKKIRT